MEDEGRLQEFHVEPPQFDGTGDVKAWLRILELIFDAKKLTLEARFFAHPPSAGEFGVHHI